VFNLFEMVSTWHELHYIQTAVTLNISISNQTVVKAYTTHHHILIMKTSLVYQITVILVVNMILFTRLKPLTYYIVSDGSANRVISTNLTRHSFLLSWPLLGVDTSNNKPRDKPQYMTCHSRPRVMKLDKIMVNNT